jgi:NADP-dependent 3-hydroxy acid dehydrogenase YdfG
VARFRNAVAIVTGGGGGIGAAICERLASEGAHVVVCDVNIGPADAVATGLRERGLRAETRAVDITSREACTQLVDDVAATHGRIDVLVNNAGTNLKARKMRELTVESWNKLVRTNLDGAFYCIREVLPQMIARKDGMIINVNSISGKRAYPLAGAGYAAGKFGLHALAGCLASEELESGIRVSSIYPGEIDTPILEERPTPVTAEQRAKILKPEDVAVAIVFVAGLPPHVSVPELVIKPTAQMYF